MEIDAERMAKNIELTRGLIFSQRVLLALVERGMNRDEAYEIVQRYALKCWNGEGDFRVMLSQDPAISSLLSADQLRELFDVGYYLRYVDDIFDRFDK